MCRQYLVVIEVRTRGAIGEFSPRAFEVRAHAGFTATEIAVDEAHTLGLETRFPLRVNQMERCAS